MQKIKGFPRVAFAKAADEYHTVPAGCNTHIGTNANAVGDYLESVIAVVSNATVSGVSLIDGTNNAISLLPNAVGSGVGTYPIPLGVSSTSGAWRIVTNNGVEVIVRGLFS